MDTLKEANTGLRELALFAGAGGGILGGHLLGWRTVCAVEINPYAASVLVARQNDGILPAFPVWDDVCTFDGRPWRGIVDVISGGFPCQDISSAGKGAGIEGERSGLWKEFSRIIGEIRPKYVLVENSPMLTVRGLGVVLGDLAEMGYDAEWGVLSATNTGLPHRRNRIWIIAHDPNKVAGSQKDSICSAVNAGRQTRVHTALLDWGKIPEQKQAILDPEVHRSPDGVAYRVDRFEAIGNGQVPAVVKLAWELLR